MQLFLFAVASCFLFKLFQFLRHGRHGFGVGCGVKHFLGFGQQSRAEFKLFQRQCRDGTRTEVIHRNAQLGPCFQPFPFGLRDVHDRAVARCEVAVGLRVLHECKVFQVRALAELVETLCVAIVHQDILVRTDEGEHTGTFHRILPLFLQMPSFDGVGAGGSGRSGTHYALPRAESFVHDRAALVFEEQHVFFRFRVIHDVPVYGGRTEVEQQFRLRDVREVFVHVRVEQLEVRLFEVRVFRGILPVVPPDGVINHIFPNFVVPDDLRRPNGVQVFAVESRQVGETGGEVDGRVLPMDEVGALHQDESVIALPTLVRAHVRHDHIKCFPVPSSCDVRVPYAFLQGDGVRGHDRTPLVEGRVVISVVAQGITYLFAVWGIVGEEGEEVTAVRRRLGRLCQHWCHGSEGGGQHAGHHSFFEFHD